MNHEYAGITGVPQFVKAAQALLFGAESDRIVTSQTISGTGALRLAGEFLNKFFPGAKEVYVPTPTWGNHNPIFKDSHLDVKSYRYYKADTCGLDLENMLADIKAMPQ